MNRTENEKKLKPESFDAFSEDYSDAISSAGGNWGKHDYFTWHKTDFITKTFGKTLKEKHAHLLDFGAGTGEYVDSLNRKGMKVVGVEPSFRMIRSKKVVQYSGKELPFADESLDFVYSICVFHHILPEERAGALAEIKRVLKKGGIFLMIEHNLLNPLTKKLVNSLEMDRDAHFITPSEGQELLGGFFSFLTLRYLLFFPAFLRAFVPLERFLGWCPLGGQYALWGKK